jgi:hypothetical protein
MHANEGWGGAVMTGKSSAPEQNFFLEKILECDAIDWGVSKTSVSDFSVQCISVLQQS